MNLLREMRADSQETIRELRGMNAQTNRSVSTNKGRLTKIERRVDALEGNPRLADAANAGRVL